MKKYLHRIIVLLIISIAFLIFKNTNVYAVIPSYIERTEIEWDDSWKYADFSKIHTGKAYLYTNPGTDDANKSNHITVCVNAGHGTAGGESVQTYSHPDKTGKVTGGTNAEGAIYSMAVSSGMDFYDGQSEASVTLKQAIILRDLLLQNGYNVLMIREEDDVQLDNIARTVIANNNADCHIAIHWDGDELDYDKGAFYMAVPSNPDYRKMEPVKSNYQKHQLLGNSLINGLIGVGITPFGNGTLEQDLTQTSYSTIPSIDIELGNRASDTSTPRLDQNAKGLAEGINRYFKDNPPANSIVANIKDTIVQTVIGIGNAITRTLTGQALMDKIIDVFKEKAIEITDVVLDILDFIQSFINIFQNGTLGTAIDATIVYNTDKISGNENINKYINVKTGETNSDAMYSIDGEEEGFDSDTKIPFIPVDMYNIIANQVADFDINFFTGQNDTERHPNNTTWLKLRRFIATLIRVEIFIASAVLIITLIWHGISIVLNSMNPKLVKEHKDALKDFSVSLGLLIGSIAFMIVFILLAENITNNIISENNSEFPISVSVSKANYWFKTNPTGYMRYMAQISNKDMFFTKITYTIAYAICILINFIFIRYVMIPRTISMIFLSLLAPIIAVAYAFGRKEVLGFSYTSWMINYLKIASIQFVFAAILKLIIMYVL